MENPRLYASANGMQKKDARETLSEFRDRIAWIPAARVLDVGCGSGEVTTQILLPLIPPDFKELTGVDISSEMIEHARTVHRYPKVSFVQLDIARNWENITEELKKSLKRKSDSAEENESKFEENNPRCFRLLTNNLKITNSSSGCHFESSQLDGYDVISSFYCLHWITNQRSAIRNIFRLLKPKGEALLVFLAKSPIFTLYRKLSSLEMWKEYMKDVDNFIPFYQDAENPKEIFADIVRSTGFQVLHLDCKEKNYVFDGFSTLQNAIAAVNPFLSRIPNHLREDFISECLRQIEVLRLAEYRNSHYNVSYKLIVAHIQKPV